MIPRLGAGQEMLLRITAQASRSGDHVFRAELECNEPETKLAIEEWTRFYGDQPTDRQADRRQTPPHARTPAPPQPLAKSTVKETLRDHGQRGQRTHRSLATGRDAFSLAATCRRSIVGDYDGSERAVMLSKANGSSARGSAMRMANLPASRSSIVWPMTSARQPRASAGTGVFSSCGSKR